MKEETLDPRLGIIFLQCLHKISEVDVYDRKFDIFLLHRITESGIVIVFIHSSPKLIIRIKPQRKVIQERKKKKEPIDFSIIVHEQCIMMNIEGPFVHVRERTYSS